MYAFIVLSYRRLAMIGFSKNAPCYLLCSIFFLGISSCEKVPPNVLQSHTLDQCKKSCIHHFAFCHQNCVNNCPTCSVASAKSAAKNYAQYVSERRIEGKKVMRELNSYRDPLQCRKVSCDCMADLALCNKGCKGVYLQQETPYCV